MSADYDRLFNSGGDSPTPRPPVDAADSGIGKPPAANDPAKPGPTPPPTPQAPPSGPLSGPPKEAEAAPPRHALPTATQSAEPQTQRPDTQRPDSVPAAPAARPGPQAWPSAGSQQQHRGQENQQAATKTGAAFDQPQSQPAPIARPVPPPPPSEHFAEGRTEVVSVWPLMDALSSQGQTSAAQMGNHRAIDALSHVGVKSTVKMPSQRGWRHVLYMLTRINLGLSPDEIYELELFSRIRRTARDSYQIGVLGLKGGVGKTAVTVALGSMLSKVRGDRILAIDADPDGGNLADRAGRQSAASVTDLLSDKELTRYNDIRAYTSMNDANLEVLASQEYSVARRAFAAEDWEGATGVVSRYYNLVLADCGAGLFHPATRSVLSTVAGLVIVASASLDGARQAAVTLDWLRQNGYQDLLGRSCVVINHVTPSKPNIDVEDLVQQFERHVPAGRVIVLPWDKHIASSAEINLDLLDKTFQRRILELAAALSDDFERLDRR